MLEMRVSKNFVRTEYYDSIRELTSKILEVIKEGQAEGVVRKDANLFIIRQLVLGILEHIVTRWLLKGEKYDLMEHYNQVSELVFSGISSSRDSQRFE